MTTEKTSEIDIEINWLKGEIVPTLFKDQQLIGHVTESDLSKFLIKDVSVDLIDSQEAFMLTTCYRACVAYEFQGAVDKVHLFVKKTPQLPQETFDAINFKSLFTNEIIGYGTIVPHLEKFAKLKLNTARFFYANLQSNCATLITEDFTSHGWQVAKERVNLPLDLILMTMKYLARFHAAGFALRITDRKSFDELTKDLQESRYANDLIHCEWKQQVETSVFRTIQATRKYYPDIPEEILQKHAKFEANFYQYSRQLVQPVEPMVTLCHGDFLRNNVAYKYDGNRPIDIMMFDLQTLRVSSPMLDVIVFMNLSTFAEVRQTNFQLIFGTYCEQLKKTYEDIVHQALPGYLSYDSLIKEYIKFMPFGIITAAPFLPVLIEPINITSKELLMRERSKEEIIDDAMTRGGTTCDRELANQMKEMCDLAKEHNIMPL